MTIFATQPGHAGHKSARDAWLRALQRTAGIAERAVTLPQLIEGLSAKFHAQPALSSPEASLTYAQLSARCNQYSRWGISRGLASGDVVALLMQNCAEYVAVWLGLSRIGVTVALINSQLAGDVLAHSINIAGPKYLIAGADLAPRIGAIRPHLPKHLRYRVLGTSRSDFVPLATELGAFSGELLPDAERLGPSMDSTALYVYTSGTTGLPKAAKVSHYRLMQWSHWFAGMMDTQPSDRMFNCLPLYHSVGGVVANFATLVSGGTVVIRPRFSASDFWRDVRDEGCTL
ncbi:MAG: long-chain acyl-CoA synthetase, partial [Gammaproteobacteria bacterium]|nr:long-chain acyl-CoA synthetase [Gammaproteobacteria bacterium]